MVWSFYLDNHSERTDGQVGTRHDVILESWPTVLLDPSYSASVSRRSRLGDPLWQAGTWTSGRPSGLAKTPGFLSLPSRRQCALRLMIATQGERGEPRSAPTAHAARVRDSVACGRHGERRAWPVGRCARGGRDHAPGIPVCGLVAGWGWTGGGTRQGARQCARRSARGTPAATHRGDSWLRHSPGSQGCGICAAVRSANRRLNRRMAEDSPRSRGLGSWRIHRTVRTWDRRSCIRGSDSRGAHCPGDKPSEPTGRRLDGGSGDGGRNGHHAARGPFAAGHRRSDGLHCRVSRG